MVLSSNPAFLTLLLGSLKFAFAISIASSSVSIDKEPKLSCLNLISENSFTLSEGRSLIGFFVIRDPSWLDLLNEHYVFENFLLVDLREVYQSIPACNLSK